MCLEIRCDVRAVRRNNSHGNRLLRNLKLEPGINYGKLVRVGWGMRVDIVACKFPKRLHGN